MSRSPLLPALQAAAVLASTLLAGALVASCATAAPERFEFRLTPYMIEAKADDDAQAFVATHIKPGMPMEAAMREAASAGARCRRPEDPGDPVVCSYIYQSQTPTGDLGEVEWRIEINPAAHDTVDSAEVTRVRHGL